MDFSAAHTGFVAAAYALSAAVLLGLCAAITMRDRWMKSELQKLESRRRGGQA